MENLVQIVLSALAVLLILTIHEYAHAYAAYKLGDNTAKNLGRLSLNPLKHLDPFGALCMILFHFGWAKPVPINARNFKNPKRDFAITALAGPLSNMVFAFLSAFFILLIRSQYSVVVEKNAFTTQLILNLYTFLVIFHQINIGIGLLLSFSYILFSTVTSSFAISGATTPFIAMWIPNVIYLIIGIILYKRASM
jgi:Zn-dependent protease